MRFIWRIISSYGIFAVLLAMGLNEFADMQRLAYFILALAFASYFVLAFWNLLKNRDPAMLYELIAVICIVAVLGFAMALTLEYNESLIFSYLIGSFVLNIIGRGNTNSGTPFFPNDRPAP